jgi:hypothetical protein
LFHRTFTETISALSLQFCEDSHIEVCVPASFLDDFKSRVMPYGSNLIEVRSALKIREGVVTTGKLGSSIRGQFRIEFREGFDSGHRLRGPDHITPQH